MDGYVTIGAKLDTKQLEKDLKVAEKELQQLENERLRMANDLERKLAEKKSLGQELDTGRGDLTKTQRKYDEISNEVSFIQEALQSTNGEIDTTKVKISNIKGDIKDINEEMQKTQRQNQIVQNIEKINTGLKGAVTKVGKWGLALIGVRGAFSFISSSMSTISQYDKQLGADIQYIKFALAMTLKPVIEFIVKLAYQLLRVLQSIIYNWTGYNIFKNSSKGLYESVKYAKQLKKQLAGFDEMNVLSDMSGGGAGGGATPSMDLSKIDQSISKLLEPENMKKSIETFLDRLKKSIEEFSKKHPLILSNAFVKSLYDLIDDAKEYMFSIIDTITNIGKLIKDIVHGDWTAVKEDFINIIKSMWDWSVSMAKYMIDYIKNTVIAIYDIFFKPGQEWFDDLKTTAKNKLNEILTFIKNVFTIGVQYIKDQFNKIPTFFSTLKTKITSSFNSLGTKIGDTLSSALKKAINVALSYIETKINNAINMINKITGGVNNLFGTKISKISTVKLPRLAKGGIVNMPGRGVPIGGAITGEAGPEGVIPLTDSQQMRLLGEAIGKYITINATITNTMNGRVISKEIQRINNDNEFIYNG